MTALLPYPEYKPSGIPFLDDVPVEWSVRPAVTMAKVLTSTVDKHTVDGERSVQLCNYTDVYYNDEVRPDVDYMKATASGEQIASFAVTAGDVVFTKDSETADDIGISAYVPRTLPGVVYGYHLATYRPRDIRYGKFLKWVMDSRYAKATLQTRTLGVTRVGLSQNTIRYLRVPTPAPDEAALIADFLDRETAELDAFIADQEELIGLLAERRKAMQAAVLSRTDAEPRVRLRFLFEQSREDDSSESEVLSVYRDYGVIPKSSRADNFNKTPDDVSRYLVVRPGYLVVNKMKAWQGSLGVSEYEGIVSPDYEVLRPASTSLDPRFVHAYLRSPQMIGEYAVRSVGIRPSQWRLYWDQLRDIAIPLPSPSMQRELCNVLDRETVELDAAIADAREAIALSRERRAALISAAVTGKIDVREAA
ncbi:restriction endonuclease subunit S [Microbacterium wangchenii]|uniref:restriction endonuclease subunit S n=1 Tax=Microbacterium wangchenii TaxID=2541726 RepID=UPI0011C76233|nr:restriction endonuclease subunit S [Microbacterium wangchenii]TXK11131.1 restriction endonuclease subunit S [Microbacterium wangchenii]